MIVEKESGVPDARWTGRIP